MSPMQSTGITGVYRGVRSDWVVIAECAKTSPEWITNSPYIMIAVPFLLADVPLSLAADTLFLPFDIAEVVEQNKSKKE